MVVPVGALATFQTAFAIVAPTPSTSAPIAVARVIIGTASRDRFTPTRFFPACK